jgi:hypothetical protein
VSTGHIPRCKTTKEKIRYRLYVFLYFIKTILTLRKRAMGMGCTSRAEEENDAWKILMDKVGTPVHKSQVA